jgi:hypothetical protein
LHIGKKNLKLRYNTGNNSKWGKYKDKDKDKTAMGHKNSNGRVLTSIATTVFLLGLLLISKILG